MIRRGIVRSMAQPRFWVKCNYSIRVQEGVEKWPKKRKICTYLTHADQARRGTYDLPKGGSDGGLRGPAPR